MDDKPLIDALKWYGDMASKMGGAALNGDSSRMLKLMHELAVDYGKKANLAISAHTAPDRVMEWELVTDRTLHTFYPAGTVAWVWGAGYDRPLMMAFRDLPDLEGFTHICIVEPPGLPQPPANNPASQS